MPDKVLFAKIGWMKHYKGEKADDKPLGGGAYNDHNVGAEAENFLVREKDAVYGFVRTGKKTAGKIEGLNLKRIDPKADSQTTKLDRVWVVFLAAVPHDLQAMLGPGLRVIGWYRNAEVYDNGKHPSGSATPKEYVYYNIRVSKEDIQLVGWQERTRLLNLTGTGGMQRTNVRYGYTDGGNKDSWPWMEEVLQYVRDYDDAVHPAEISEEVEAEQAGYQQDPLLKKAVEKYAVDQADSYYTNLGYHVKFVGKPYDLLCTKGTETLCVEVKGTRTSGAAILLTRNEVAQDFLKKGGDAELFVVSEIFSSDGSLSGGQIAVYSNWRPHEHRGLVAYQYQCELNQEKRTKTFPVSGDAAKK